MNCSENLEKNERWRFPRFFAENDGANAYITGQDAKHLFCVMRMRKGDLAVICDGKGKDFLAEIVFCNEKNALLKILESRKNNAESSINVTLFQCLPKGDKMDFIVQKATELGADKIVPVISKRCVSRPDEKNLVKKIQRWQKIADEASKQCGRGKIPSVESTVNFSSLVREYPKNKLGILFYEQGGKPISEIISPDIGEIGIVLGSEGGFEDEEAKAASENGFILVTLGKRILRCETAPVAALSILMNLTGNM